MKTEPINLTFKSGSLWYGEYQVVNPEVIPGISNALMTDDLRLFCEQDKVYKYLSDGDQITLPEGYGIKYTLSGRIEFKEVGHSEATTKTATIITPEKPENSAHGYTEGAYNFGTTEKMNEIKAGEYAHFCNFLIDKGVFDSLWKEFNSSEPSESQEEPFSISIQRDLRVFVPKMVSGELDEKLKLGYVQLINGKRVELILKIEVS